jgi:LPS sulfotransferase NodH
MAREEPRNQIWPHLRDDKELHIIHLLRRNLLKAHISQSLARHSGQWRSGVPRSNEPADPINQNLPIQLDYDELLQDFERTRSFEMQCVEDFKDHPTLNLWYEELTQAIPEHVNDVQEFLGLDPLPLAPSTRKQDRRPLDDRIENYVELKRRFAGSEWAEFFEAQVKSRPAFSMGLRLFLSPKG